MRWTRIGRLMKSNPWVVRKIVERWIMNGNAFIDRRSLRTYRHPTLTPMLEQQLVDPKLLLDWTAFSLKHRVNLIAQKFNCSLSEYTLGKIYKRNKVKWRTAN